MLRAGERIASVVDSIWRFIPEPFHMCMYLSLAAIAVGTVSVMHAPGPDLLRAGDLDRVGEFALLLHTPTDSRFKGDTQLASFTTCLVNQFDESTKNLLAVVNPANYQDRRLKRQFARPIVEELNRLIAQQSRAATISECDPTLTANATPDRRSRTARNRDALLAMYGARYIKPLSVPRAVARVLESWYDGFGDKTLLAFAFQMCMIVLTGAALARVPMVIATIQRVATWAVNTPTRAVVTVAAVSAVAGLLSWGFSLILSALLAREIGKLATRSKLDGIRDRFHLIVAASYMGLLVWHGGVSGSAPLLANDSKALLFNLNEDSELERPLVERRRAELAKIKDRMPPEKQRFLTADWRLDPKLTTQSYLNLKTTALLVILIPCAFWYLAKQEYALVGEIPAYRDDTATDSPHDHLFSRIALFVLSTLAIGALVIVGLSRGWVEVHTLGFLIFAFLFLGLLLFSRPGAYQAALQDGARDVAPILLQFPFYWGIFNILQMDGAILVDRLAGMFVSVTNGIPDWVMAKDQVFVAATYFSSCVVDLFVPSGGGHWMLQGPIVFTAAANDTVNRDPGRLLMAIAYGDQVANMIQPFFLLPILSVTKASPKPVIAVTAVIGTMAFLVCLVGLLWF